MGEISFHEWLGDKCSAMDLTRDRLAEVQQALRGTAADTAPATGQDGGAATAPRQAPPPEPLAPGSPAGPAGAGDLPTVTVTPPATEDGPVILPGLVFDDQGDDAAAALSLSEGARTRAADAARAAAVADASTDLLRGLVGDPAAPEPTSPNPPPAEPSPQPTDPLPPPAGELARVTGTAVNLRAGPSTGDPVVGQVSEGQTVRVLTPDRDGWSGIEDPASGDEVFIASRFLDILR